MTVTAMTQALKRIAEIAKKDGRYHFESYIFIQQALAYAQFELGMGLPRPFGLEGEGEEEEMTEPPPEAHLTGQQLCEAARLYALDMYGLMAKVVLNNWGIETTTDFGNIVFKLIEVGEMTQSAEDRLEDFKDLYDFEQAFQEDYEITMLDPDEA